MRKTTAQNTDDLEQKTADLKDPDNLKTEVVYDEKNDTYSVGTSLDLTAGGKAGGKGTETSTKSSTTKTSSTRNTPKGASANTTSL